MFKTFQEAYRYQQEKKNNYDNGLANLELHTGVSEIDDIPFALGNVVWIVMGENYSLYDYEESATEYGVTEDGKWCALYDGHCSCYGWEAHEDTITYYDSLEQLIECDEGAKVIINYKELIKSVYEFIDI